MVNENVGRWKVMTTVALAVSFVTLLAAATSFLSPCSIAHAQSGVCTGAETVTVAGGATINEDGGGTDSDDFRAESDTEANALFLDASAEELTIDVPLKVGATPTVGSAGQYLTSGGSGVPAEWRDGSVFQLKGADETVTGSTTLQDDDDFSFTADADAIYLVELLPLMFNSTTGGAIFNWTGTGFSTHCARGAETPATVDTETCGTSSFAQNTLSSTGDLLMPITFVITADSDGGTITLQWAQNSANGSTIMRSESMMVVTKLS